MICYYSITGNFWIFPGPIVIGYRITKSNTFEPYVLSCHWGFWEGFWKVLWKSQLLIIWMRSHVQGKERTITTIARNGTLDTAWIVSLQKRRKNMKRRFIWLDSRHYTITHSVTYLLRTIFPTEKITKLQAWQNFSRFLQKLQMVSHLCMGVNMSRECPWGKNSNLMGTYGITMDPTKFIGSFKVTYHICIQTEGCTLVTNLP